MIPPQLHRWRCGPLMRRFCAGNTLSHLAFPNLSGMRSVGGNTATRETTSSCTSSVSGDGNKTSREKSKSDDRKKSTRSEGKRDESNNFSELITITEVSTQNGVRWLDVGGRTQLWAEDSFVGEGEFVAHAMGILRGGKLPHDMIAKVTHNVRPLPFLHFEEKWACLTLRCARQNPRWLSMTLHDKVKDFRSSTWAELERQKHSKLKYGTVEEEDDVLEIDDEDDSRVRRDRRRALSKYSSKRGTSSRSGSQASMMELTDRLHIFLLKEDQMASSSEKNDKQNKAHLNICQKKRRITKKKEGEEGEKNEKVGDEDDPFGVQWWIVTVHRYRVPFLEDILGRWATSKLAKGTWIGIVRRLIHGATVGIQGLDYKYAERLDELETVLFKSATRADELSRVLTQVHIIHRRSKIHANLLRETQHCYVKLLAALNLPTETEDEREILYLSNALSLADELYDQSGSLLTLQFSIAAYMLEEHLRVLTVFTTFFIPLDLIASWFGTNFAGLDSFFEDPWGLVYAGLMLGVTAIFTNVWMRRRVIHAG